MGTMSPFHWAIVLLVIVLLFGAKKIPDLAKGLGQGIREFKKASNEAANEMKEAEKPDASKPAAEAKKEG